MCVRVHVRLLSVCRAISGSVCFGFLGLSLNPKPVWVYKGSGSGVSQSVHGFAVCTSVCLPALLYVYLHLSGSLPKKGDSTIDPKLLESLFKG